MQVHFLLTKQMFINFYFKLNGQTSNREQVIENVAPLSFQLTKPTTQIFSFYRDDFCKLEMCDMYTKIQ